MEFVGGCARVLVCSGSTMNTVCQSALQLAAAAAAAGGACKSDASPMLSPEAAWPFRFPFLLRAKLSLAPPT